ncbi:MAG: 1-deoxy-D-xylulose-5-phosphate synthase [Candidatus Omnitrophica bacterium]|nr:1-deoxy-D-xylulose-5-phosphate synthase [Candidatus Omnitrophota bacterium]
MADLRDACFDEIYNLAKNDPDVIFLTADMGAFSLQRFKKDLPLQYLNVGISEQVMISVAAGLALEGKKVFVYSIAPFVTLRCYEQIKIDLCCMNLPVVIIGIGTGLMYGGDGPTHHSVHDIAVMRALPNLQVLGPCDTVSTQSAVRLAYSSKCPSYIRIERGELPDFYAPGETSTLAAMTELRTGRDVSIISTGVMTHCAMSAAKILSSASISVQVIDLLRIHPLDSAKLMTLVAGMPLLVTLEEHSCVGGLGGAVAELWADQKITIPLLRLALPHEFCFTVAGREDLLIHYGLDSHGVARSVQERLGST